MVIAICKWETYQFYGLFYRTWPYNWSVKTLIRYVKELTEQNEPSYVKIFSEINIPSQVHNEWLLQREVD